MQSKHGAVDHWRGALPPAAPAILAPRPFTPVHPPAPLTPLHPAPPPNDPYSRAKVEIPKDAASLAQLRERLAKRFPVEDFNAARRRAARSSARTFPAALRAPARAQAATLRRARRAVAEALPATFCNVLCQA